MAKRDKKPTLGRPKSPHPKDLQLAFRIDGALHAALLAYRDKLNVTGLSVSYAARDLIAKGLKQEGLL